MTGGGESGKDAGQRALLDEALKKGALIWLELDRDRVSAGRPAGAAARAHPRWYAWTGGTVYLLTGEEEQPDPGLTPGETVRLVARSKDNRHRLVTLDADVSTLAPVDDDWAAATAELTKARLNLSDAENAPRRWAEGGYRLYRLTPRLPLLDTSVDEGESHRAAPIPSPATTADRLPWVLHRRGRTGRPLS